MPSNDAANNFGPEAQVANLALITATANSTGAGIHINNAGHRLLFERVLAKGIDTINCTTFTSVEEVLAGRHSPLTVFPNPFTDTSAVEFETGSAGIFEMQIMDMLGRRIAYFKEPLNNAGTHRVEFSLPLPAGTGQQVLVGLIFINENNGVRVESVKLVRMGN